MKKELARLVDGIGFSEMTERRRKTLSYVLLGSLGAHLVGLLIFGSVIVMRGFRDEKTVFVAPPPTKAYQPRQLEHRVKVQKRQRSSSRPSMMPRLAATKPSNLNLPEISMDPKVIKTSFQPKFKAVSGRGLGAGIGTGYGVGGFGTGVSSFNFFGIRGRGDKIAILVDVSVSMVEPERGGEIGFVRVKDRINKVIDALSEQALFTVVAFADAAETWQEKLVIAGEDNREAAKNFIRPFNTENNWGLRAGNVYAPDMGVPAEGGTTRLDLALYAAFEQGADTILVISDGLPQVKKGMTQEQLDAYYKMRQKWLEDHADEIKAWQEEESTARHEMKKVWQPARPARPAVLREGKTEPARPAQEGHWVQKRIKLGGADRPKPKPPDKPSLGDWQYADFLAYLDALVGEMYEKKGRKRPIIHTIGYQIDREGGKFLRKLSAEYKGKYRRVTRLD